MTFEFFLFHIFLIFSIVSALMVISLSNAIHSVLFLILTFCNVTLLLLLLGAEFFSFLLLIVYVGAIAVLFLFVIMMLNIKINTSYQNFHVLIPIILIIMLYIGENLYYFTTQFDLLQFFESQLY
jgi:NADH-quinone oxidoreductase subunit J